MDNKGLNLLMAEYEENVNLVAKINTELCKRYGLENYLTEFSSNIIRQLNQYKRFIMLMSNRPEFINAILEFSRSSIAFFEANKSNVSDKEDLLHKMDDFVNKLDNINNIINETFAESVKNYLKEE